MIIAIFSVLTFMEPDNGMTSAPLTEGDGIMGLLDSLKGKPKQTGPYSGGSGTTMEDAVIITAPSSSMGVPVEHEYVQMQCGRKDGDCEIKGQVLLEGPDGKRYDLLTVKLKDGTTREFYFDISSFYGKF